MRSAGLEAATAMRHSGSCSDFVKNYLKRHRALCEGAAGAAMMQTRILLEAWVLGEGERVWDSGAICALAVIV